ncbi:MAG: chorismate synthase [Actinobacteria bacterium HGW-Actinobacteria-10]|jgi:chorismate synthase|nr:MAG: chorismate synthase [Actinobacteria bacterium HGW-Actinobacteria-10]
MRYTTSGESHGRALTAIVTGVPAGIPIEQQSIDADLARRQVGYGRGGRMAIEQDRGLVLSGVRFGRTIGSPVTITVANRDWDNWTDVMSSSGSPDDAPCVTAPRPGHADLPGILKTGSVDVRDILERASARETAARVAAGSVAKAFLTVLGVSVRSLVTSIGDAALSGDIDITRVDWDAVESSDVRCPDAQTAAAMRATIDAAAAAGESLGGTFCVVSSGVVPGLGGYAEASQRIDAALAAALVSIPAIKGVEFGDGFRLSQVPGSRAHDEIHFDEKTGYYRTTNHAGGLEGGMTNGEQLVVRAAMKPIPTLMTPLASVDIETHEAVDASRERSDVCAVPAAAVVAEAEVAMVLAHAYLNKFGHDCMDDISAAVAAYRSRITP